MEEYICNICEKSIEALGMENHVKESDHVARKKMLEEQLQENSKYPKSSKSTVDLWKKD